MKKIVLITYQFYPENSPRGLRWSYFYDHFKSKFETLDIVTTLNPNRKESHQSLIEVKDFLNSYKSSGNKNLAKVTQKKSYIKKIAKQLLFPDFCVFWSLNVIFSYYKRLKNQQYNIVITSSHPFSTHLIGFLLKRKNTIWIAELGDPYSTAVPWKNRLIKQLVNKFESFILNKTNHLVVPVEASATFYRSRLKTNNIHCIPQSFSTDFKYSKELKNDKINIVYTGVFYKTIREPEKLFNAIDKINDDSMVFHFVGALNEFGFLQERYIGSKRVIFYGHQDRHFCLSLVKDADLVLNLANLNGIQIPSKIIDYLNINPKILTIIQNDDVEMIYKKIWQYSKK